MKNSIIIREIETIRYLTNEFVILNIYISELINDKIEMIEIIAKIYLVCNFKIKLLIDVDVLDSEESVEMKAQQCCYVDNKLHDLTVRKAVEDDESNMLKSEKMNQVLIGLFVVSDTTNRIRKSIF